MNTVNKILLGVLAAQSLLAVVTHWPDPGPPEPKDLIGVKMDDIQLIRITGRKAQDEVPEAPVELARKDSGWVIRSKEDYPASDEQMRPLLEALGKMRGQALIATGKEAYANLEVADNAFTRKVEIEAKDGTKRELLIGVGETKASSVRVVGEDEVWSIPGVTPWNIADTATRYFDKEILEVDISTVTEASIQRPGQPLITFRKTPESTWTLDGLEADKSLDQRETTTFIDKLLNVRMADPASTEVKPEMGLDGPDATVVTWTTTAEGQSSSGSYRVGAGIEDKVNRHYMRVDGNPWVVEVLKANVEQALSKNTAALVEGATIDLPPGLAPGGAGHGGGGNPHGAGGAGGNPHGGGAPGGNPHGGGGSPH